MRGTSLPWLWRVIAALTMAVIAVALSLGQTAQRADDLLYDLHLASWGYPVDGDVVMVAIDNRSLNAIGQWPWPRNVHARLLDRLREAGVRAAALDLILAEPDRSDPANDVRFAESLRDNGRVVLPVIPTMQHQSGPPIEVLPNPVIAAQAPVLGHTDVELENSGAARDLYLYAGLGEARWPALALAMLQLDPETTPAPIPGLRRPEGLTGSPYQWVRDYRVRIRYAGPPDTFPEVSYVDVLEGRTPDDVLRGRLILVGVTAAGIAQTLRTPMSGKPMNGVEYQANVVEMLLHERAIVPVQPLAQAGITGLLTFLGALFVLSPSVLGSSLATATGVLAAMGLSIALLRLGSLWFAPAATMGVIGTGFVIWMGRHLLLWRRQAHIDTLTLLANRRYFDAAFERRLAMARRSRSPFSLLLFDIDHFKRFNDAEGHLAGDKLLVEVARTIGRHARRSGDLAARFGGDEFALILPDTPMAGAARVAGNILDDIRRQPGPVTLSIGISTCIPGTETHPGTMFAQADAALYRAKQSGRDGYAVHDIQKEAPALPDATSGT